jgi:hypothetical protein
VYVYFYLLKYRFEFILPETLQEPIKKRNIVKLVPLNPNVLLAEKDVLKRPLFRNDDILLNKVRSEEFQNLLLTDPTTLEGQEKIVKYFGITDEWATIIVNAQQKGHISDSASTYFFLLLTLKYRSNKDNIWMSFYEGLHRHTALLLSLTSSAFNLTKNEIKFKSLTSDFFLSAEN